MVAPARPDDELRMRARAWAGRDPDPVTRAAIDAWLDADELDALAVAFGAPLTFGTAGLRGAVGPGPAQMSRLTVIEATAGVAAWLTEQGHARGRVVVGRDARHGSEEFARDAASVFAAAGFTALWYDEPLPTPVLAFATRHLDTVAGVVITASHNPGGDNGYKLYLGDGSQIVPPVDRAIEAQIERIRDDAQAVELRHDVSPVRSDQLLEAYVAGAVRVVSPSSPRALDVVATAMHGVGASTLRDTFVAAGFPAPHEVREQAAPDPDFPTVAFPNPEEPGALDLALALARERRADLVVANDPDADRLAVAVPLDPGRTSWRPLTGDELGVLLADHLLQRGGHGADDVLVTTIVSSRLLRAMAAEFGVAYAETLTGFKWVVRAPGPGQRLLFGYEEALGYCVGDLVRDKDGITAALVAAELAAEERSRGRSLLDRLDDIHRRHGVHHTTQRSLRIAGAGWSERVTAAMETLRRTPPTAVAGRRLVEVDDLLVPTRLPSSDVLVWQLDGARVVVRPSGTEPKVKCYVEAVVPVEETLDRARDEAAATVDAVARAVIDVLADLGLTGPPG